MNLSNKVDGSVYTPQEWNEFKNELQNWIVSSGLALTGNSLQVKQAAARYAANAASYTDSGIANAYSLVSMNSNDTVSLYANGTIVSFKAGATNTGNSTIAISGLAAKTIKKDGFASNLVAGDIEANKVYTLFYSISDDAFEIIAGIGGGGVTVPDASTTVKGILQLATQADVNAGIDTQKAVTSATLDGRLGQGLITNTWITFNVIADTPTVVASANFNIPTRDSKGNYSFVFLTPMANLNYILSALGGDDGDGGGRTIEIAQGTKTVNGFTLRMFGSGDGNLQDPDVMDVSVARMI